MTFWLKAARGQLAFAPVCAPPMLGRQRLVRFELPDDLVDLGAVQRAPDAQDGGQHYQDIAMGEQEIVSLLLAESQETLGRFRRLAAQRREPDRLLNVTHGRHGCVNGSELCSLYRRPAMEADRGSNGSPIYTGTPGPRASPAPPGIRPPL